MRSIFVSLLLILTLPAATVALQDPLRRQGTLGARLRPPAPGRAGAEVSSVAEGGPAAAAGLRQGDRVLRVGTTLISDGVQLSAILEAFQEGDSVLLETVRDGQIVERRLTLAALPRESTDGVETIYGSVLTDQGYRVRTIVTRPRGATARLPGIFLVPWLSCDSSEVPAGRNGGSDQLLRGIVTRSGAVVMRVDRPGLGDSEGQPCVNNDFLTDLRAYRAALRALARSEYVDPDRIYLLGVSNGGGVAPLVSGGEDPVKVAGYVVAGGWSKTWFEHMMDHERMRLGLAGTSQPEIARQMRGFAEFYDLYLNGKMTPGEIARQRPHLAGLWYDAPGHQYGRPAAFYHQLQDLELAAAWAEVGAPTLAVYGDQDWIMSRSDHELIVDLVNRKKPGAARLAVIPKMDHFFRTHDSAEQSFKQGGGPFAERALVEMLEWFKSQGLAVK